MKLSVIMPVHNGEKYIKETLDCLLRQSLGDQVEYIIVNDGSTDQTARVLSGTKDSRMTIVHRGVCHGVSQARNLGLSLARGDYVMFVDSDDLFHGKMLEILYNLAARSNADISICNYERVSLLTRKTSIGINDTSHIPTATFKALDMRQSIFNTFDGFVWNKIFNRKFLIKNNILFDDRLSICEDSLFVYKSILSADRICFTNRSLIKYKVDDSASASAGAKFFISDICYAVDELARFLIRTNKYAIFEYSFKLWAERKCSWARTMIDGAYSARIEEIMRKYKLNDKG